jgi:Immunity protein 53
MDDLEFLMTWFQSCCDGDWEHDLGIRLATLDNPGWSLDVRIADTYLDGIVAESRFVETSEQVWLQWRSTGTTFEANCGPGDLRRALRAFREFAEKHRP